MIRDAVLDDVPALVELENRCFDSDRLSARSFRRFLTKGRAVLLVATDEAAAPTLVGYALVLFHTNTALARLYSLAVSPESRNQGTGQDLLHRAEQRALERGATRMRLEVREDNVDAITLYGRRDYRAFDVHPDYYEDHGDAVRMEKLLAPHLDERSSRVPYYEQSLNFTCGPAALMMAMRALNPRAAMDRAEEIQLWREATTIFMTSGHGGCGPLGLALSARRRGFDVEVSVSDETEMFTASVRSEEKKDVIRLVEASFQKAAAQTGIPVRHSPFSPTELRTHLETGAIPLVLISLYRLTGDKSPHWIVVTGADDRFFYINDPYTEEEEYRFATDCIGVPIRHDELVRMMRFGRRKHFAAVIVKTHRKTSAPCPVTP